MTTNIDSLLAGFKREFWEHKRMILGIPVVISGLCILGALMAMIAANHFENKIKDAVGVTSGNDVEMSIKFDSDDLEEITDAKKELRSALGENANEVSFGLVGFYISAAWVACFYYLLATLYTDRKDKSILFWKSLPVSETQNVLTKLAFGCIGIVAVAIVVAWMTSIVLGLIALGHSDGMDVDFSLVRLVIWPIGTLFLGLIWGAPIFAYTIFVSAMARRSPFLLLILPPIVIPVLEWILFSSSHLITFFGHHVPFSVVGRVASEGGVAGATGYYFSEHGLSLILGLIVAIAFTAAAVWYRNNKFEI